MGTFTEPLPGFIIFDPETQEIAINETTLDDIGLYEIEIRASLDDRRESESSMIFFVELKCIPSDFSINIIE